MSWIEIITLSFVQALTEFLPVSSTGHLILLPKFFGWQDQGLEMDVAVHVGTLLAVLFFFWRDIWEMILDTLSYVFSGFNKEKFTPAAKLAFVIVLGTLPAILIGATIKKYDIIPRSTTVIGIAAIGFGILLYIADRAQGYLNKIEQVTFGHGFIIGIAQAIALIPGTSRSGICITAARFMGFDRPTAARFAFLLSIPAILGAAVLTTFDAVKEGVTIDLSILFSAIGLSFIFGLAAIGFFMKFISRFSLTPFVIYRIILGIILLY